MYLRPQSFTRMPCTILIVDDHPSFRASARVVLESEGFNVVGEAADGASALQECCRLRPQVVLLDVQLPDIDGFDVCEQITSHIGAPDRDHDLEPRLLRLRPAGRAPPAPCGFVPKAELSGERVQELLSP